MLNKKLLRVPLHSGQNYFSPGPGLALAALLAGSQVMAAAPVAVDDVRTVLEDRAITINVLANDYDPDRDVIQVTAVSDPNMGTTRLNSDGSITYTPTDGFLGVATFTYTITDVTESPSTATGTVTINMEEFDLPPFAETDNTQSVAEALDGACQDLSTDKDNLTNGEQQLLERCEGLLALGLPDVELAAVLRIIAPEETASQFRVSSESSRQQTTAVNQRLGLLKKGANQFSVNGISMFDGGFTGGAAGDEPDFNRFGLFASLQSDGAERDSTDNESGYDQSGLVFTFGGDYAVSPQLFLGAAFGVTQSELDYDANGGELDTDIGSLIAYATYYKDQLSFDLQLGYGAMDFDSKRRIQYIDGSGEVSTVANANTEGSQLMINGQVQYDWYQDALSLSPYLRLDYVDSKIDAYGENDAEGLEIEFEDQSYSRLTLSTGIQGSYSVSQDWGVLLPTFQASLLSETSVDQDDIVGRFAFDPDDTNSFTIQPDGEDTLFYQLGIGVVAALPKGLSVFAEYLQTLGYENTSIYQINAGIRYEL